MKLFDPVRAGLSIGAVAIAWLLYDVPDALMAGSEHLSDPDRIDAVATVRTSILQFAALCGAAITVYLAFLRVKAMDRRNELQGDQQRRSWQQAEAQLAQTSEQLQLSRLPSAKYLPIDPTRACA